MGGLFPFIYFMKKAELMELVGHTVRIVLFDNDVFTGKLGYTTKFCEEQNWRKPNYFTIDNLDFKVSHIKKISILD